MRINLNQSRANHRRKIFLALVDQMCDDYDMDQSSTVPWVRSDGGLDHFVRYLRSQGYTARVYSWPDQSKDSPRSWGLEFDDDDPLIVALRLKYVDED